MVAGAMVGLSTWGNEPDIFRYAKAGRASWWNMPTLAISYFLGAFIFPIMGYLVATSRYRIRRTSRPASATSPTSQRSAWPA